VLASLDLTTGEAVSELDKGMSRVQPRVSPDGGRTAFIALTETAGGVVVQEDGRDTWLVRGLANVQGLAWTADGRSLVYAAEHAGMYRLWVVGAAGGEPRALRVAGDFAWNPSIARSSGDLAWEQVRVDQDLWRISVHGRDPWRLETGRFLASTRWEYEAAYSRDGTRLAFVSARSGAPELWVCRRDGSDLRRLTDSDGAPLMKPVWSADGARLAYNALVEGRNVLRTVPVGGGEPVTHTPPGRDEVLVGWDAGDAALEFLAGTDLRRRPLEPAGADDDLVAAGVVAAARDGEGRLYQVRADAPRSVSGPGATVNGLDPLDRRNWRLTRGALAWVLRSGGQAYLMIHELGTDRDVFMTDLPGFTGTGLAVAPDGDEVLYTRAGAAEGDLMLLPAP
jgi:hypothetical protein